jgi:ASCH domain-containing protein
VISKAITIRQPWAHAVIHGWKPIENRSWSTRVRGTIAIHAAQKAEEKEFFEFLRSKGLEGSVALEAASARSLPHSAVIGIVDIVDCVTSSHSPWFEGPFAFVLANPRPLHPIACRGGLQIFDLDPSVTQEIERQLAERPT